MIKENLELVKNNIIRACDISGRSTADVTLIAVSKTKPVSDITEAYNLGIRDFGENKVKELLKKKKELPSDIRWHMIGHLQTNKVKQILGEAFLIHSIDSIKLSDTIEYEAAKSNKFVDGLLEINVAEEESKYGFRIEEIPKLCERLKQYKFLRIKGLMTVAPDVQNPEDNREVFKKLSQLSVDIAAKKIHNVSMCFLSMGMTGDYEVAVEEGANYIRVGTGIFGARDYGKEPV